MNQVLCIIALITFFSFSASGQTPCDTKESGCVRFEALGMFEDAQKNKTYRIRVVNNCDKPLKYVVFQLPKGMTADQPSTNSRYIAPSGRKYKVRNPNHSPFHSIRFKTVGGGIAKGASDIFDYSLSPQANLAFIHTAVRLGSRGFQEAHLSVSSCPPMKRVSGHIRTENGDGIAKVDVQVVTGSAGQQQDTIHTTTNQAGEYTILVKAGDPYTVTPRRNDAHKNGVTTFDLVLISKNILHVEKLDSPYKLIAADVNKSRSINTIDMVEIRKLLLHIDLEFRKSTSWRFVDKAFVFPNPENPFTSVFPESISGSRDGLVHDFVGIKVGDVNGSVVLD